MSPDYYFSSDLQKRTLKAKTVKSVPLVLALAFQAILLVGTVFVVIFVPNRDTEPEFAAPKTIYLPQRELEHRMAVSEFEQAVSRPLLVDKLTTAALLPDALPSLPHLPALEFNPLEIDNPLSAGEVLFGQSGLIGALQGLKTEASRASLFGIEDTGERILILFDDGGSVVNKAEKSGIPMAVIKERVVELIDSLNANTLFGLVNFVRQVGTFRDYMVPATIENKGEAKGWIEKNFGSRRKHTGLRLSGSGIEAALEVAFRLEPDVIFLLSDADFQRNVKGKRHGEQVPWDDLSHTFKRLQNYSPRQVRIHFIGFQVEEEHKSQMQRFVRRTGGEYRDIHGSLP